MLQTNFGNYKYLGLLAALSIMFELISNFTGARLVTFGGRSRVHIDLFLSDGLFASPMFYGVYGYSKARNVLWLTIFCRFGRVLVVSTLVGEGVNAVVFYYRRLL